MTDLTPKTAKEVDPSTYNFYKSFSRSQDIPGWFFHPSHAIFDSLLNYQCENDILGNQMEIGVYHGKVAVVMAHSLL